MGNTGDEGSRAREFFNIFAYARRAVIVEPEARPNPTYGQCSGGAFSGTNHGRWMFRWHCAAHHLLDEMGPTIEILEPS